MYDYPGRYIDDAEIQRPIGNTMGQPAARRLNLSICLHQAELQPPLHKLIQTLPQLRYFFTPLISSVPQRDDLQAKFFQLRAAVAPRLHELCHLVDRKSRRAF